ncbi:hypothetical protein CLAIMM_14879 [Cladophialophora immunda]|nr:hypothetical protein CLAIMM_14879 [Cladophialophora immunda]
MVWGSNLGLVLGISPIRADLWVIGDADRETHLSLKANTYLWATTPQIAFRLCCQPLQQACLRWMTRHKPRTPYPRARAFTPHIVLRADDDHVRVGAHFMII